MPRTGVFSPLPISEVDEIGRGRPRAPESLAPIAAYDTNPALAVSKAFDRVTGKPIQGEELKTYAEVLAQYHLSCEGKVLNGDFLDAGRTERRLIQASRFDWIGKEANRIGDSGNSDPIVTAVAIFTPNA
jgi:hypothetical protein